MANLQMKAYGVGEEGGIASIVFARHHNTARSIGFGADECGCLEYEEIEVWRMPELDAIAVEKGEGILDWEDDAKVYRDQGWWYGDEDGLYCEMCEKYVYKNLPESQIDDDMICRECADKQKAGE